MEALAEFIGDIASSITTAVVGQLVRRLNISPGRRTNFAVRAIVYVLVIIPVAVVVFGAMLLVIVLVLNWVL